MSTPERVRTFICEHCGGAFPSTPEDEALAHTEALRDYGRDGRAAGMAVICDDCYQRFKAWERRPPEARNADR